MAAQSFLGSLISRITGRPGTGSDDRITFPTEGSAERYYIHPLKSYMPPLDKFGFRVDAGEDELEQIVQRLVTYYHFLSDDAARRGVSGNQDMWTHISQGHEDFRQALASGDTARVAETLLKVGESPLVVGYLHFEPFDRIRDFEAPKQREARQFADKLLALAEALGCKPMQCVEQGAWGYDAIDYEALLGAVAARAGFDTASPRAGGSAYGLHYKGGVTITKDLHAIYTAGRARDILANSPSKEVAEIGGGTGTLAYYLVKAGMQRVNLFDLPIVSVLQAYFLMRSLGAAKVSMFGEERGASVARVNPYWALTDEGEKSIDLFINQDSMPEIERAAAMNYLRLIRAKGRQWFFSINQEGQAPDTFNIPQSVVFQLVEADGGYQRASRNLNWMRAGYVEELYRIGC